VVINTTDPCGCGREKERSNRPLFGKCELINRETVSVCSSPMRKNPPFFCAPKIRQSGLRNLYNWDPALSSHTVKKKKEKENLRHKSHYCIAQSPKGEAENQISLALPLC